MLRISLLLLILTIPFSAADAQLEEECPDHDCVPTIDAGTGEVIGCQLGSCDDGLPCVPTDTDGNGICDCCKCAPLAKQSFVNAYAPNSKNHKHKYERFYDYELMKLINDKLGDSYENLQIVVSGCFSGGFVKQATMGNFRLPPNKNWSVTATTDQETPYVWKSLKITNNQYVEWDSQQKAEGLHIRDVEHYDSPKDTYTGKDKYAHGFLPYYIRKYEEGVTAETESGPGAKEVFDQAKEDAEVYAQSRHDDKPGVPQYGSSGTGDTEKLRGGHSSNHALIWSPAPAKELNHDSSSELQKTLEKIDLELYRLLEQAGYSKDDPDNSIDLAWGDVPQGKTHLGKIVNRGPATLDTLKAMLDDLAGKLGPEENVFIYIHSHGNVEINKTNAASFASCGQLKAGRKLTSNDLTTLECDSSFVIKLLEDVTTDDPRVRRSGYAAVTLSTSEESYYGPVDVTLDGMPVGSFEMNGFADGSDYEIPIDDTTLASLDGGGIFDDGRVDVAFSFPFGDFRVATQWDLGVNGLHHYGIGLAAPPVYACGSEPDGLGADDADLFQDGFPATDIYDPQNLASMAIRLDSASDIAGSGSSIATGDSMVVQMDWRDGTLATGLPVLHWLLEANPVFDSVRSLPVGSTQDGTTPEGKTRWRGILTADEVRDRVGNLIDDLHSFDFPFDGPGRAASSEPDEAGMFFPGDQLRYYVTGSGTLMGSPVAAIVPPDTTGFSSGNGYDRDFLVNGLPGLRADGEGGFAQPQVLLVQEPGSGPGSDEWEFALLQNGLLPGRDYDVYRMRAAMSNLSNGIGSMEGHGTSGVGLAGYSVILYSAGTMEAQTLSDGSNTFRSDKEDDLSAFMEWYAQPGSRTAAFFGHGLARDLYEGLGAGTTYLYATLGVDYFNEDVSPYIDYQGYPVVSPTPAVSPYFFTEYSVAGSVAGIGPINAIQSHSPGVASHEFLSSSGAAGLYAYAAGVSHSWVGGASDPKLALTFPYDFAQIRDDVTGATGPNSARAYLLGEILGEAGLTSGTPTQTPRVDRLAVSMSQNYPNPFNPQTEITLTLPRRGFVRMRVFDLHGKVVDVLIQGELEAGEHRVRWNGKDQNGKDAASGTYFYLFEFEDTRLMRKMVLVR